MRRDGLNSPELEKSTTFLLDAVADILAAVGATLSGPNKLLLHSAWEDLRKIIESAKPPAAEARRQALNLSEELAKIMNRLAVNPTG
ncbi:MAG: hypothetical protein LBV70_07170, partial [Candidatus Adiutrix sp.]|nr:hypothetical protein [Candidatus Adiutrix sp.]